ncbi:Ger(x)C family spore germination protein [Paenibacillus barcinonensis]|uniref:Ger(X)C family spore germination protein n=1 Tax=Paenibacillus barcinonensis TaxID=198119 RepID=A0A2V4VGG3_PAEBA|nr:Ger(x)C family spore germination protein [Paenibacillus barcinonensis]PYE52442.1 spore germination protein KC [Paenibacillus barcinonensis]QKS59449.1 Ger(x)C family spore germination protein [Paenibacillus barcinonensis]
MNRLQRFVSLFVGSLLLCLLLGGCWDRKEVNDLALVTGVAIDQLNDKFIEVSVQIYIPQGSGQGSEAVGQATGGTGTTFVQSAYGVNIADAFSQLQMKFSRKIFWGHAEVYLFGAAKVERGLKEDMDFFMRDSEPRERAYIFVSKGKAKTILEKHSILERNTSEVLREMAVNKTSINSSMAHLMEMLEDESNTALLPWVELIQAPGEKDPTKGVGYINGTAILHDGKLIGIANDRVTRGIMWAINEMNNTIITIHPEDLQGTMSVQLLRNRSRIVPVYKNGEWSVTIHVHSKNQMIQNTTEIDIDQSSGSLRKAEKQLAENIEQRIHLAMDEAKSKYKADIFNFAGAFHRKYPRLWKKHEKEWHTIFPQIKVTVKAKADILRPGMFNTQQFK